MKFLLIFILLFVGVQVRSMVVPEYDTFSRGSSTFGFELYKKVFEENSGKSVIISPMSVHTALGLTFMGAAGNTASQMAEVLHLGSTDRSVVEVNYKNFMDAHNDSPLLKVANKIYVQTGFKPSERFREIAVGSFYSDAEIVDFTEKEKAAKTINDWVEEKTNNKIHELISKDVLSSDTRMVLVNAVHFKGLWEVPFAPEDTEEDDFWISETESKEIDMMNNKARFFYGKFEELDAKALKMEYKNSDLSMIILLPNKRAGLANLVNQLADVNLLDMEKSMSYTKVLITIPKFKIEFDIAMKDVLKEMGMVDLFGPADLSLLLEDPTPLKVSEVVHKAFIEVNEEGTEAAAATGAVIQPRIGRVDEPARFNADHPFVYFIKDGTGKILFIGNFINE